MVLLGKSERKLEDVMSWSINLNGPPQVVTHELADALFLIDKALDWAQNSDKDIVNISLCGYVSWNEDDVVTSSNVSFSIGESVNQPSE
jgi:hypothetical protein